MRDGVTRRHADVAAAAAPLLEADVDDVLGWFHAEPEARVADVIAALTHRRVREAGRTHGRGSTTALAICLK
jgi:hypothetical protein